MEEKAFDLNLISAGLFFFFPLVFPINAYVFCAFISQSVVRSFCFDTLHFYLQVTLK